MKIIHLPYIMLLLHSGLFFTDVSAQVRSVDLMGGVVFNAPSPLLITQESRDNILHTARYKTESMEGIPYFLVRLNYNLKSNVLEFQYLHHKIKLNNTTGSIQHFEITDGYNLFSLNYRFRTRHLHVRIGLGAALVYTKSTIRGYEYTSGQGIFNSGYFLAGPVLLIGANREINLSTRFYLNLESQFTASWVLVPVAAGYAHVSNFALHLMLGMGYQF